MDHPLLQNPLNRDIVALLVACQLPALEKELWLSVLPDMTDEEKEALKENLKKELDYEVKISEEAVSQFIEAAEKTP